MTFRIVIIAALAMSASLADATETAPAAATPAAAPPAAPPAAATAQPAVVATVVTQRASPVAGTILVERGTMIRLMVVNELSSRTAKIGDHFPLRVDEEVVVGGARIIPVGATAWGEVTSVKDSAAAGVSGKLGANLLYVEAPGGHVPIQGDRDRKGATGGAGLGLAIYSFGPFGLLLKGNDGRLKAGDIFNGYFAQDMVYDPVAHSLVAVAAPAPTVAAVPAPAAAATPAPATIAVAAPAAATPTVR